MTDNNGNGPGGGADPQNSQPVSRRRLGRRIWLPALAVVVIAAVVVVVIMVQGSGSPRSIASPTPSPDPTPSTTTHPCHLRVVESGFSIEYGPSYNGPNVPKKHGDIDYGAVIENPCHLVASKINISIDATNASGKLMTTGPEGDGKVIPELLPSERIGIAGQLDSPSAVDTYDANLVAGLHFDFFLVSWGQLSDTRSGSPTSTPYLTADHIRARPGAYARYGYKTLTFTLDAESHDSEWGYQMTFVLVRDRTGRIVSGTEQDLEDTHPRPGDTETAVAYVPHGVSSPRFEIYLAPSL